jgi:hypothetical protein
MISKDHPGDLNLPWDWAKILLKAFLLPRMIYPYPMSPEKFDQNS